MSFSGAEEEEEGRFEKRVRLLGGPVDGSSVEVVKDAIVMGRHKIL